METLTPAGQAVARVAGAMGRYLLSQGFVQKLVDHPIPDTAETPHILGYNVDLPRTKALWDTVYHAPDALIKEGDWIEARGTMVEAGNTSRKCEFEIYKIGGALADVSESAAEFLSEPVLTLRAVGTTVVPKEHQRFGL